MKTIILLALLVSIVCHADPLTLTIAKRHPQIFGGPPTVVTAGEISQTVDHFSTAETRTFKQRYWITSTYASGANAPVLLSVCGESACGSSALQFGPLPKIAKETGAYIVSFEHRYYGKSQPFSDLSTGNLKFLSTAQAIEDLRVFRSTLKSTMNMNGPWILVGGSYAGNLAAYTRRKYPAEFVGAVASSAPVRPDPNFTAFDHLVGTTAGRACVADLQKTLAEIESTSQTADGYAKIRAAFAATSVSRRDDFLYLLADVTSAAILLGLKDEFCASVHADGVEGLRTMKEKVDHGFDDYSKYTAEQAEDPAIAKWSGFGMRQWFYQSCQEYGFWQNAWPDIQESARSHEINATYHDHLCQRLFGLPKASTTLDMQAEYFVPLMTTLTTNVFFSEGELDPWSAMGVRLQDRSILGNGVTIYEIPGALHCEDLTLGGSPAVQAAKTAMGAAIKSFLGASDHFHP